MDITINRLNKVYRGGVHVLNDVDLNIPNGMFGLIGPNGAGKTTLMRILAGILRPSSGTIHIGAYDGKSEKGRTEIKRMLGYLPQDLGVYPDLSAREFLDYIAILKGMDERKVRQQRVVELLETVSLAHVANRKLKTYSSFVLSAPVTTVDLALGKFAGGITAVCIMTVLVMACVVYNYAFARYLLVGSIDQRIPVRWGLLNRNRVPGAAIILQTGIACTLATLFFMVVPYVGVLSGPPEHLAASFYFVLVGTATVLWAFATIFLFIDLLWLMMRRGRDLHYQRVAPLWLLGLSSLVGLIVGLLAIVDTVLNSYDLPDIPNGTWRFLVAGLTAVVLIVGAIGGMLANSEATWQSFESRGSV